MGIEAIIAIILMGIVVFAWGGEFALAPFKFLWRWLTWPQRKKQAIRERADKQHAWPGPCYRRACTPCIHTSCPRHPINGWDYRLYGDYPPVDLENI